jgi:transcriptional regulator NrdR family protein
MKNEKQLAVSDNQLTTEQFNKQEIAKSLVYAMDRCDSHELKLESCSNDIEVEFINKLNVNEIKKAIRTGAMGKYGVNYKITTQVVGSWIYKYIKETK